MKIRSSRLFLPCCAVVAFSSIAAGKASAQFQAPGGQAQQPQAAGQPQPAAPAAKAVAVVNNEPITETEFRTALENHLQRTGAGNDPNAVREAQQQVMSGLVESRLVEQHLISKGPEVPPQEVRQVIDRYKQQMEAQGVGFQQFLRNTGYDERTLQRRIQGSLAWQKYQEREVTEENLQQHFRENQERFAADEFEQAKPLVQQSYVNTLWTDIVEQAKPQAKIEMQPGEPRRNAPVGGGLPPQP